MCYASSVGESFLDDNAFSRSILFFLHLGNPLFPSLSISWNQCHQGRPYMLCLLCLKCRGDPGGRPSGTPACACCARNVGATLVVALQEHRRPYILCLFYSKCRGDPGGRPSGTPANSLQKSYTHPCETVLWKK